MMGLRLGVPVRFGSPGPIVAIAADSKGANGAQSGTIAATSLQTGVPGDLGPRNYLMWGCMLSPAAAKIQYGRMCAQGGETTAQILARLQAALPATPTSLLPHYMLVDVGTNDVSALTTFSTVKQTFLSIYSLLGTYGITPIVVTQAPRDNDLGSLRSYLIKLNNWLVRNANANGNGYPVLDAHAAVVDPSTGNWTSGLSADGIHPNSAGAKIVGQALADLCGNPAAGKPGVLRGLSPAYLATSEVDTFSQITAGGASHQLFLASAGGLATGWSNISGSPTLAIETDATNYVGNAQSVTRTAADGVVAAAASLAATAGDVCLASLRFFATVEASGGNVQYEWLSNPSQATVPFRLNSWDRNVPWSTIYMPMVTPSLGADTGLLPRVRAKGAAGALVKIAQHTFANVTTQGIA
jgi:lysophospholipase L1-like esterase